MCIRDSYTDEKLECDFKRIDETLPEQLTYDEAYSIYELNGWGNLVRIEAVSYTHLDVYKRQS